MQRLIAVSSEVDRPPQVPANQRPASNERQDDTYMALLSQHTCLYPAPDVPKPLQVILSTISQHYQQNQSHQTSATSTSTNHPIRLRQHGRSRPTHRHSRSRSRRSPPSPHPNPALHPLHHFRTRRFPGLFLQMGGHARHPPQHRSGCTRGSRSLGRFQTHRTVRCAGFENCGPPREHCTGCQWLW